MKSVSQPVKTVNASDIFGSHGDVYEDNCLEVSDAV
jgi:hypothetical protein